jgi:hypothetical protein
MAQAKDEHGLTPRQKRFATLLATKPDTPQYKLAIEAGVPAPGASVWAARTSRLPHVQAHYQRLTSAAVQAIKKERGDIASIAEVLQYHSRVMRGRVGRYIREDGTVDVERVRKAPGGAIKKYRSTTRKLGTGDDAIVLETTADIELSDPQGAANALLGHYSKLGPSDAPVVNVAIINQLPTGPKIDLIRAFLSASTE